MEKHCGPGGTEREGHCGLGLIMVGEWSVIRDRQELGHVKKKGSESMCLGNQLRVFKPASNIIWCL